jgi:predicted RNA-binding protein with PUA-like domain
MKGFILKSEPDAFSIDDLMAKPGRTTLWDGVRNYTARNNLMAMKKGDRAFLLPQ